MSNAAAVAARGRGRLPRFTLVALALLLAGLAWAGIESTRARRLALADADASLASLARIADALWSADQSRIHALLARLRIELRAHSGWNALPAPEGREGPKVSRATDNLLRRALDGTPDVVALELVVAGADGLTLTRIEPGPAQPAAAAGLDLEALATTRWYADEAQEAVAAHGRRVAWSRPVALGDGESTQFIAHAVIALHDADEVVQGVLVATIDLGAIATGLASLPTQGARLALVTRDGRTIGASPVRLAADGVERLASADAGEGVGIGEILERDGRRSLVQPVPGRDGRTAELFFWIERDAPISLARRLLSGGWSAALAALGLLVGAAWSRDRAIRAGVPGFEAGDPRSGSPGRGARARGPRVAAESPLRGPGAEDDSPSGRDPEVRRERIVLREWLADLRGCLEREAASRGLTLDLRCERSLPREIEHDPLWLGGLVIALGREALDATSASRVALEVMPASEGGLRFEIDAGEGASAPAIGMERVAERLGASLVRAERGRLAVVVEGALA